MQNEPAIPSSPAGSGPGPKLFVGLSLGPDVRARVAILATRLSEAGVTARFEDAQKYHVTLAFLGIVDPSLVPPLQSALQAAAARNDPSVLTIDRIGAFPNERRPRVIFAGTKREPGAFRALVTTVRAACAALGFQFRDDAVAHVTLARMKEDAAPLPAMPAFEPIDIPVAMITLFESIRAGKTTRYEALFGVPLGS